ncbi:MAG: tetratricopeptide repeat protein [Ferruginibacter sp.]
MRSRLFIILLFFTVLQTAAQRPNTDSLWHIAETTQNDSLRLQAFTSLHLYYIGIELDSTFSYSSRMLQLCDKLDIPRYRALGILNSSYVFYRNGDYSTVQEHIVKASAIAEQTKDAEILARIENYRNLIESDPLKKIVHLRKAIQYKRALMIADPLSTILLGNLSGAFLTANQTDSAFFYAQKMYEQSIKSNDTLSSYVTAVMGNVYLKMNQPDLAFAFYKRGIKAATATQKIDDLTRAFLPMANYFDKINQPDSALYYWKKPFEYGPREAFNAKFNASRKIYAYYLLRGNNDSAVKYMNIYIAANDSVNSTNKVAQLQAAKFEEELRQQELEHAREAEMESRNHNIQLAVTAIAILIFLILFLLLSRSILVSHQVVAFLNVLVLLIVFEFVNLLIHPWLEKVTHHSPALMLTGLVAIGALLVPLHHKLEHWTTQRLVEKNKAIRLAKAKKTIEELEEGGNTIS